MTPFAAVGPMPSIQRSSETSWTRPSRTASSSRQRGSDVILCFVVFDRTTVLFSRTIKNLGTHSYGLYLCHYPLLGIIAKVVRTVPWVSSQGWLVLPLLFGLTIVLSMLLMESVARLPTKRVYRYLFG